MKLKLFFFFLACFSLNTNAQLLWKITGKGLKAPSYLMGTHHLAPLSIMDSIKGMQTALNSTTQVIGELNMSDIHKPANIQLLQQKMMIDCDTTLQTLLSPPDYDMVNKFTKEYLNFELSQVPKLKPAFISNNAVVIIYVKHVGNFNPQEQLDSYFQKQGTEKGKKIEALETLDFQLNILYNSSSLQRQAQLLVCALNDLPQIIDSTKRLSVAYMAQDLNLMQQIAEERQGNSCDPSAQEMESMITARNQTWAKKLPTLIETAPSFIAVGALHLPGEEGLINLLRAQGYEIEAVW